MIDREIANLEDVLRHKRGQWQICRDNIEALKVRLLPFEEQATGLSDEITRLEGAIKTLKGVNTISFQTIPTITASMAEPWFEYAYSPVVTVSRYDMEYVLVNKEFMVFKCECPAFRFTKGELANGKTCKHIDRYTSGKAESSEAFKARRAFINLRALRRGTGIGFKRGCYNFF